MTKTRNKVCTIALSAMLFSSMLLWIQPVEAVVSQADVCIIQLSGVPGWWVNNTSRVCDGAREQKV
jgi:hypothetical protein